jgi:hypothetical protein
MIAVSRGLRLPLTAPAPGDDGLMVDAWIEGSEMVNEDQRPGPSLSAVKTPARISTKSLGYRRAEAPTPEIAGIDVTRLG